MQDFEKLGVFYLGREFDTGAGKPKPDLLLYDSKDLVTHAVCVGMTGSGKTGLCLSLLEEAAIDAIPAIIIDPKGDLGNLLLTFPGLNGSDFEPWVNEEDARKAGVSTTEYAGQQAEMWKKGLAEWGQDGDRIRRLREAAEFTIYTPGSSAGVPLSVLKSFDAPPEAIRNEGEMFRERIAGTVTSLLGLVGIDADPVQSREHILLSSILAASWKEGKNLSLGELIQLIQTPPMQQVGVMDIESFFPSKNRFALAMQINNLLASPGFEAWMQGEPLEVNALLHTSTGKPRMSIISIAHLNESERMFVVSLLLNQVVSWMRSQEGTTSLRAIVYMDEIFGYFPPVSNPPSKQPLLTLLKQARAYGVGVVLATQNPVDLDYKGLSNAGTWFIGRLQTERDKARVLEGLEGAASTAGAKFDRNAMEETLAGLAKRTFLMNNVHEDGPVVFQVRWAMSYLRGPLTRDQIRRLQPTKDATTNAGSEQVPSSTAKVSEGVSEQRPVLPPDVPQTFLPIRSSQPKESVPVYQPFILASATIHFADAKLGIDQPKPGGWLTELPESAGSTNWEDAEPIDLPTDELEKEPAAEAKFAPLPSTASKAKNYETWKKSLTDHLYRTEKIDLFCCAELDRYSNPGETERDFRVRLQQSAREERDALAEKIKQKYGPKVQAIQERIRKADQSVDREKAQSRASVFGSILSAGTAVLGAVFSRKKFSASNIGKAATTARSVGRATKEAGDVGRAKENVQALEQQLADLETKFQEELATLDQKIDPVTLPLTTKTIKPKKTNIDVRLVTLAWVPHWQSKSGETIPAWK